MEEELIALLVSNAGVSARLSGRVYFGRKPQGEPALPYAVLTVANRTRSYDMRGDAGHAMTRVQVDVYATTYKDAKAATRAVSSALSGYRGGLFQGVFLDGERDLTGMDAGDVNPLFRISTDFMIHHNE
jgi:hypothetical protein